MIFLVFGSYKLINKLNCMINNIIDKYLIFIELKYTNKLLFKNLLFIKIKNIFNIFILIINI